GPGFDNPRSPRKCRTATMPHASAPIAWLKARSAPGRSQLPNIECILPAAWRRSIDLIGPSTLTVVAEQWEVGAENCRHQSNLASRARERAAAQGTDRHLDRVRRRGNRSRHRQLRPHARLVALRSERIHQSRSGPLSQRQKPARDRTHLESAAQTVQRARADRHVELRRERRRYRLVGYQRQALQRTGVAAARRRAESRAG